jgi:hypothetical protein
VSQVGNRHLETWLTWAFQPPDHVSQQARSPREPPGKLMGQQSLAHLAHLTKRKISGLGLSFRSEPPRRRPVLLGRCRRCPSTTSPSPRRRACRAAEAPLGGAPLASDGVWVVQPVASVLTVGGSLHAEPGEAPLKCYD